MGLVGRRLCLFSEVRTLKIRQSDLASFTRCPQQKKLNDQVKAGLLRQKPEQLSMTAYGSVLHQAVSTLEALTFHQRPDALERAHATFEHYWAPENISDICEPVTIWAARQTYGGMLRKGHQTLDLYAKYLAKDRSKLLALEVEFNLPFALDGEPHVFHGTMDRLSLRKLSGQSYLNIEDFKSGADQKFLRWNAQFTGYCLDGDTPILMASGQWSPLRDVSPGDHVLGFDEHAASQRRRWREATVLRAWTTQKQALRITFEDGRHVVCSHDHRWLSRSRSALWQRLRRAGGDGWVEADALRPGDELAGIFAPQATMCDSRDYMRGYVAGANLGDGTFRYVPGQRSVSMGYPSPYWVVTSPEFDKAIIDRLGGYLEALGIEGVRPFRQKPNPARGTSFAGTVPMVGLRTDRLDNCERLGVLMEELDSDGYRAGWLAGLYDTDGGLAHGGGALSYWQKDREVLTRVQSYAKAFGFHFKFEGCDCVRLVGDRLQRFRFTSLIQPVVARKNEHLDGRTVRIFDSSRVVAVQSVGVRPLFDITTSTSTFLANGVLSHNCWATTQQKFWTDAWGEDEGLDLHDQFRLLARRGTWVSLKNGVDRQDAGWRGPQDYARFWAAIHEYIKAVEADVYPLSLTGAVCFYCKFREGICGGVAVPDEDHGRPPPKAVKS